MRDLPKLSWLNGKTFVQSNGGRKNAPGRAEEHKHAHLDAYERAFADANTQLDISIIDPANVQVTEDIPYGDDYGSGE
jgi:hypothetical protein